MSTATERIMRQRGDLSCFHGPFMYDYYVNSNSREMPHFTVDPQHPVTYAEIRDRILCEAQERTCFIKDMSYYVVHQITTDELIAPYLVNCFLIRNPLAAITSYAKLDSGITLKEVGLEAQWQHFSQLRSTQNTPVVLDADDIRAAPRKLITDWWQRIGLPACDAAFAWTDETPADWQQVGSWHRHASDSRHIKPPDATESVKQQQDFANLVHQRPELADYLHHHQPYYEKLRAHRLVCS